MHFPPTIPCHPPKFLSVMLGISREFFFSTLMRICLQSRGVGVNAPSHSRNDLFKGIPLPDANRVKFDTIFPDWSQAPSDSPTDLFDEIPLPPHDVNYAGLDYVEFFPDWQWLQTPSDSRNEEFDPNWDWNRELNFTNEIPLPSVAGTQITEVTGTVPPVAAADSARNHKPNGRTSCTYEGCFKTFGRTADFRRHLKKHNPNCLLHCRECHYTTHRKDKLREHQNKRHGGTVSM